MNLKNLSPAPWTCRAFADASDDTHIGCIDGADGRPVCAPTNEGDLAIKPDDAAFILLARQAIDIMLRRGWGVQVASGPGYHPGGATWGWRAVNKDGEWVGRHTAYSDPFSALVEADRLCPEGKQP